MKKYKEITGPSYSNIMTHVKSSSYELLESTPCHWYSLQKQTPQKYMKFYETPPSSNKGLEQCPKVMLHTPLPLAIKV
jgi:hypothetical protein